MTSAEIDALVRAAQVLVGKGVGLTVGHYWDLTPNELRTFLLDEEQWEADCYGVSKDQLREYYLHDQYPHCAATTKKGTLCKNKPSGAPFGSGPAWFFAWHCEGYCRIHGG